MTVTFGNITFDSVTYYDWADSLCLQVKRHGGRGDDWDATEEGDPLTFRDGQIISVEILGARHRVERGEEIILTLEDGTVLRSPDVLQAIPGLAAA
jgi:hypothetical protein